MKKLTFLVTIILLSCNNKKATPDGLTDEFKTNINNYSRALSNNSDKYEPGVIFGKVAVTDTNTIKQLYDVLYSPRTVSFDEPDKYKTPLAKDITQKFNSVYNSFKAQNKFGAIVNFNVIIYMNDKDSIIYSSGF